MRSMTDGCEGPAAPQERLLQRDGADDVAVRVGGRSPAATTGEASNPFLRCWDALGRVSAVVWRWEIWVTRPSNRYSHLDEARQ